LSRQSDRFELGFFSDEGVSEYDFFFSRGDIRGDLEHDFCPDEGVSELDFFFSRGDIRGDLEHGFCFDIGVSEHDFFFNSGDIRGDLEHGILEFDFFLDLGDIRCDPFLELKEAATCELLDFDDDFSSKRLARILLLFSSMNCSWPNAIESVPAAVLLMGRLEALGGMSLGRTEEPWPDFRDDFSLR